MENLLIKAFKAPEGMSQADLDSINPIIKHLNDNLELFAGAIVSKEELQEMVTKALSSYTNDNGIEEIRKALKAQGEAIAASKAAPKAPEAVKSEYAQIVDIVKSDDFKDALSEGRVFKSMLVSGNRDAVSTLNGIVVPQVQVAPTAPPSVYMALQRGAITADNIKWVNRTLKSGKAGFTAEGAAIPQADWQWTTETATAKKVAVISKLSYEMMTDANFVASELQSAMLELVTTEADKSIISGTGTSNTLTGLEATANSVKFTATTFDGTVYKANIADAIRVCVAQMRNGGFNPTMVVMNPMDIAALELIKNDTANYIGKEAKELLGALTFVSAANKAQGKFTLIDPTCVTLHTVGGVELEFGFIDDDFENDLYSVKVRLRPIMYVPTPKKNGIISDDFATIIAKITTTTPPTETPEVP